MATSLFLWFQKSRVLRDMKEIWFTVTITGCRISFAKLIVLGVQEARAIWWPASPDTWRGGQWDRHCCGGGRESCQGGFPTHALLKQHQVLGMFYSEMEKAYKIAQMKILGPKISTQTRNWRHIAICAKNSVHSTRAQRFLAQHFFTVLKAQH